MHILGFNILTELVIWLKFGLGDETERIPPAPEGSFEVRSPASVASHPVVAVTLLFPRVVRLHGRGPLGRVDHQRSDRFWPIVGIGRLDNSTHPGGECRRPARLTG